MFTRALGVGAVGVCLSLLGCSDSGTQQSGAGGATAVAGSGGAEAGASSAGHAGSAMGGGGSAGASVTTGGASAGGSSGGGGVSAAAGSSGAAGSSAGAGGGVGGGTGGANAGGAAGANGGAGAGASGGGAGGGGDQPSCVPDGSGSITMTLSGSAPFNETRGNDYTCLGTFSSAASSAGLILRVDDPEPMPSGVVFVNLPKFEPGNVGNIAFDSLSFALAPGGLWNDPNATTPDTKRCTFNITANQALPGLPNDYRVTGSITCSSALPGLPDAMTVQKLQFVTLFSPTD